MVGVARRKRDLVAIQPVLATHALGSLDDCLSRRNSLVTEQTKPMKLRVLDRPDSFFLTLFLTFFSRCLCLFTAPDLRVFGRAALVAVVSRCLVVFIYTCYRFTCCHTFVHDYRLPVQRVLLLEWPAGLFLTLFLLLRQVLQRLVLLGPKLSYTRMFSVHVPTLSFGFEWHS